MQAARASRCRWSGSCRRATPRSTPARGAIRPPSTGSSTAGYYQKLGRTLEEGCFDMMFFDDRLAMPGIYGGSVAEAVLRRAPAPSSSTSASCSGSCAGATRSIGLGATYSTTYYSPFHVARTFATLDHLSGGRAAWNVVTSVNDSEAQNFGVDQAPRPRRALRPGRRVPRGHHRPVGHLGGRRPGARPGQRRVRRSRQGPRARLRGQVVPGPRSADRAALAPGAAGAAPGRLVGSGPGLRRRAGPSSSSPVTPTSTSPGPTTRTRRSASREVGRDPDVGEDAADGLHRRGGVERPGPGARAGLPQRLGRPDGLAHPAVRAHELRLLGARARRPHHRRADRVGVGHPRPGAEHPPAHRRRHRDAGRPGRAPGHPAAGAPLRGHRSGGGRPDGGVVRHRRLRRLRHRRHPLPRAPTRTSCGWWSPSCSAAACSATATPVPPCARTSGSSARSPLSMADGAAGPAGRAASGGGGHAGRRADGGHGAGRVRRRGHQGGTSPGRAIRCAPGATAGRHRPGVEEREPQQALRHPRPAPGRGPGPVPPAARRQRRAGGGQPTERPGPMGHRLRVGPRGPSPDRDAPHHRLRPGWAQERPPGLRDPGRGHERVRPRDRAARRAAHAAAVHAGRRRGLAGRHLRGDDGPVPPRRPRRRRVSWSTST